MGGRPIGRTPGFGPGDRGSNPRPPVNKPCLSAVSIVRSICERVFVSQGGPRYAEDQARAAIASSATYTEALRRLGMRAAGGNFATLRKYADELWRIPTDHFDPGRGYRRSAARRARPLADVTVEASSYSRAQLKHRLYREGLKLRSCELCGQGEIWKGRRISLILDHVNGVADDHRLHNLRILCPNCAATLDTHCARKNRVDRDPARCPGCARQFIPANKRRRYCGRSCWIADKRGRPNIADRKFSRPPYAHLVCDVRAMGYWATGRRYGVSDNAIRKWLRQYDREQAAKQARRAA